MSRKAKKKQFNWTVFRRKFLRAYIELNDLGKAIKAAGSKCSTEASCQSLGSQILKEIKENASFEEIMEEAGLDVFSIVGTAKAGVEATQVNLFQNKKTGEITEYHVPDWGARARFVDIIMKLRGGYPKNQMELPFEVQDGRVMITAEFASNATEEAA
ncbi:MAG: hypothetical protein KQH53_08360 [Desulfarculaceae bacterium]|nr:hypothetical protein [Desulfarculaceae bacterium]